MTEDTIQSIPNVTIGEDKRIVEETHDIPLLVNGKEVKVVVRKIETGVRNKIRSQATKTTILSGQPNIVVNDSEIQERLLSAAIVEAPFETSFEGIKKLPAEISDYLFETYNEWAEPTSKKKD